MRTRTPGVYAERGERSLDKHYRSERIRERLGAVSQEAAEARLRARMAEIDAEHQQRSRPGAEQLFRVAAGKYLIECRDAGARSIETIAGHILLLNEWVGDEVLADVCNDTFGQFKADRLAGRSAAGAPARPVKPSTVNRTLEVARTVLNRAARVWRQDGRPWLGAAPLIEMLDESATRRQPRPISWAEQAKLLPTMPGHLERMLLFALNTGARDENVCGLRWEWERPVPDLGRSVFLIPAAEFKGKRQHLLVLNDVAWRIVESQRGKHPEFVFVYRRERDVKTEPPKMAYRRVETMNNTAFQSGRVEAGLPTVRVHDLRHTFGQRLRDAGVAEEDRALLMGHATAGMAQHYATASIARLVDVVNSIAGTKDRTTVLRVVNG